MTRSGASSSASACRALSDEQQGERMCAVRGVDAAHKVQGGPVAVVRRRRLLARDASLVLAQNTRCQPRWRLVVYADWPPCSSRSC